MALNQPFHCVTCNRFSKAVRSTSGSSGSLMGGPGSAPKRSQCMGSRFSAQMSHQGRAISVMAWRALKGRASPTPGNWETFPFSRLYPAALWPATHEPPGWHASERPATALPSKGLGLTSHIEGPKPATSIQPGRKGLGHDRCAPSWSPPWLGRSPPGA
eukprot:503818-Amphidinium_carterae.2